MLAIKHEVSSYSGEKVTRWPILTTPACRKRNRNCGIHEENSEVFCGFRKDLLLLSDYFGPFSCEMQVFESKLLTAVYLSTLGHL